MAFGKMLGKVFSPGAGLLKNPMGLFGKGLMKGMGGGGGKGGKMGKMDKKQMKAYQKAMKKYGGEAFMQHEALMPEQKNLLKMLTGAAGASLMGQEPLQQNARNWMQDLLSPQSQAYEKFKQPMMQEFQQQVVPEIAERFAGVDATRSSSYQNALMGAGTDLEGKLANLRTGLQMQGIGMLPQMEQSRGLLAQLALGVNPYHSIYRPPTIPGMPAQQIQQQHPSFLQGILGNLAPVAGAAIGNAIVPGIGGAIGGAIGGGVGQAVQPRQQANQDFFRQWAPQPFQPQAVQLGQRNYGMGMAPMHGLMPQS